MSTEPITHWLLAFLKRRNLDRSDARMLFAYNMTRDESVSLQAVLSDALLRSGGVETLAAPNRAPGPAAAFVLYAAEWWKNQYEGGVWDWTPIVDGLGGRAASFSQQLRSDFVTRGLDFWGLRPLDEGRRFIGAIAVNGGIPMKLLAHGSGKLAQMLLYALTQADRYQWSHGQVRDALNERQLMLPGSYRQPAIFELLAQFVAAVLALKAECRLEGMSDPVAYLDNEVPDWRSRFPVSLESEAAQSLLTGLVREASARKPVTSGASFHCERLLVPSDRAGRFTLESVVNHASRADGAALAELFGLRQAEDLPRYFSIDLETDQRRSYVEGRLVLGAEETVARLHGAHQRSFGKAALTEHRLVLRDQQARLLEPVTAAGGGALSEEDPWVFGKGEDELIRFMAAGAARLPTDKAIVVLPAGWRIACQPEDLVVPMGTLEGLTGQREIFELSGDAQLVHSDLTYRVKLRQLSSAQALFQWRGTRLPEARAKLVFRGSPRPTLYCFDEMLLSKVPMANQQWRRQGRPELLSAKEAIGPIEVRVLHDDDVVGRQRLVVLPAEARIAYESGVTVGEACVRLLGWGDVDVSVEHSDAFKAVVSAHAGNHEIVISLRATDAPPAEIRTQVRWRGCAAPLTLVLPYPVTGGRFVRGDGVVLRQGEKVTVSELIGLRVQVFDTNPTRPKAYEMQLTLGSGLREISSRQRIALDEQGRAEVRLLDQQKSIESLLGLFDELDATVRVSLLAGSSPVADIHVARYTAVLHVEGCTVSLPSEALASLSTTKLSSTRVMASPLSVGDDPPLELEAIIRCEGVHSGTWNASELLAANAPWLIYPAQGSALEFRPLIWTGDTASPLQETCPGSDGTGNPLAAAIATSSSPERWRALHDVLTAMGADLSHPSWPMLRTLWVTFHHLPLPALDVWRALGKQPQAVVAFLFRSELGTEDLIEAVRRFRDEVGWVPELVTLSDLRTVTSRLWSYLSRKLPPEMLDSVAAARLERGFDVLANEFTGMQPLLAWVQFEATNKLHPVLQGIAQQGRSQTALRLRQMWEGGESLVNKQLLQGPERDNWPARDLFRRAWAGFAADCDESYQSVLNTYGRQLFWPRLDDFKCTVANMPMLCALWSITNTSRQWWGDAGNRLALRLVRDFDPNWFEQSYREACLTLLSMPGLVQAKTIPLAH